MNVPEQYTLPTIDFVGGSTESLSFHAYHIRNTHKTKEPFDLSNCTANFSIVDYVNKGDEPIVSKPMEIQQQAYEGEETKHILYVRLEREDTAYLEGKYIYQITIKDDFGKVEIPNRGIMYIALNIDKDFTLS